MINITKSKVQKIIQEEVQNVWQERYMATMILNEQKFSAEDYYVARK